MATAASRAGLSKRSAGVRRLLQEASELSSDDSPDYTAAPLESDLFDWHFTIRGISGSQFDGGVYHGRMILPSDYPFKPPEIYLLTPSGRFEINKKICLSISSFHPETWQPSWGVRTALLALISFFESDPKGAVGSLDAPPDERKRLAAASHHFKCSTCGYNAADRDSFAALPPPAPTPEPSVASNGDPAAEEGRDVATVPTSEEASETPSPISSPPPELEAADTPSIPPTTIFPAAPSGPRNYPHASSPNALTPTSPYRPGPSPPASPTRFHAPASSNPVVPTTPASPSTSQERQRARRSAPPPAVLLPTTALPPGVSIAQADFGGVGGPPSFVDRAILAVLLAIVALVVRKVA
ncbi:hypothetical protein JCM10212_001444 [Sporobolomyces blumeae]